MRAARRGRRGCRSHVGRRGRRLHGRVEGVGASGAAATTGATRGSAGAADAAVGPRLEQLEPVRERVAREVGLGAGDLDERELERQAGVATLAHVVHGDREEVDQAQHRRLGQLVRLLTEPLARLLRDGQGFGHVPDVLHEQKLAEVLDQLRHEPAHVLALLGELLDLDEGAGGVAVDDRVAEAEEGVLLDPAHELEHVLHGDRAAGCGGQLVERGDGVAERAVRAAGDQGERRVGCVDALALAHAPQHGDELLQPGPLEDERLAARAHGREHAREVGRAEDEDEVGWGLLDQLQKGVPGLGGQLVGLVDDVDLVAAFDRLQDGALADLAHVVDAALRGGVHLDHVEGAAARDRLGDRAPRVEVGVRAALGVQGLGEDPRHRRLARAARAGEEVRLPHLPVLDRVPQRADDRLLADHVAEVERAVGAVEGGHAPIVADARDLPGGSARGREARREVPQLGRLLDDAEAGQLLRPLRDRGAHLDHVVDVALRVGAARDREPDELHRRGALGAVGLASEHDRADLAAAHAAGLVERDDERLPRILERGDLRQQRARVDVDGMAAHGPDDRDPDRPGSPRRDRRWSACGSGGSRGRRPR